jgi:hypothetical protein
MIFFEKKEEEEEIRILLNPAYTNFDMFFNV